MAPSKRKERLPLHQIVFFSVGHVLNDLLNAIYTSYLLIFQTKILGLPSNIVGLLWFIPAGIDAPLALLVGYISDNFNVPILAKFYSRRKSWHLIGCSLVGVCTPFILMPCFFCGGQNHGWLIVVYYVFILVCVNAGWVLTQANFLALIPVIARRQSEMVKLGAISSAITLIAGIYVYVVTWVLLGNNSSETLSFAQWKEFMNLGIIVVTTGAFFAAVFHIGTREPSAKKGDKDEKTRSHENQDKKLHEFSMESYAESKIAPPSSDRLYQTAHFCDLPDVIQGKSNTAIVNASFDEVVGEEVGDKESDDGGKIHSESNKNKELILDMAELENQLWQALSDHSDKDKYKPDELASEWSSGYEGDSSLEGTDVESVELCMPETFTDMVPYHSTLILSSRRGSRKGSPFPSPKLSRSASKRISRSPSVPKRVHIRPHSTSVDYGVHRLNSEALESPFQTPRLARSASNRLSVSPPAAPGEPQMFLATGIDPKIRSRLNSETQESAPFPSPRLPRSASNRFPVSLVESEHPNMNYPSEIDLKIRSRLNSETHETPQLSSTASPKDCTHSPLAQELNNPKSFDKNSSKLKEVHLNTGAINDEEMEKQASAIMADGIDQEMTIVDRSEGTKRKSTRTNSWRTLFKNPLFYKLGAAYMFTRLSKTIVNSYLPIYLTDHLKFEKASIAYFPLVILISGVFASIATKKLNKLLGNKWTFVVGAITVIGASGWFCLLTTENRSFAYIPAILTGGGTSIMFVTTLALAAEFVDADRSSGAFLMASMGFFTKISLGLLFGLLQEFAPEKNSPESTEYVRYVFSVAPGILSFLGIIAFVLFIPATIQCRPIVETIDAETQTDGLAFNETVTDTLETIKEEETKTKPVSKIFSANKNNEVNQMANEADITVVVPRTLDTRF